MRAILASFVLLLLVLAYLASRPICTVVEIDQRQTVSRCFDSFGRITIRYQETD